MATKEKTVSSKQSSKKAEADSGWLAEMFRTEIYKRSQGRVARQVTAAALGVIVLLGCLRLSDYNVGADMVLRYIMPMGLCLVGWWVTYRAVNIPKFADFLIATEAEMNKVSWPTRGELIRGSLVVLITIFLLAAILFGYDVIWRKLFQLLNIVQ